LSGAGDANTTELMAKLEVDGDTGAGEEKPAST
jgi:hypothetical protein